MKGTLVFVAFSLSAAVAEAQTFSSGSTGASGALSLSANETRVIQVPESGIFNFTTVTVPTGATLQFSPNQRNTPVILAQGAVTIDGTIDVSPPCSNSYICNAPGPGGFYGGTAGQSGFGPAGGAPGQSGQWVGPLSLVPPVGGSGGGGNNTGFYAYGTGGGGAIVIASSVSILCNGRINASSTQAFAAGPGAGGAIRLVANNVTGNCQLLAEGMQGAGHGLIRIEAPVGQLSYAGLPTHAAVLSTTNPQVLPSPTTAALTIASIGGFPVLSDAGVRPGTVDVVLPRGLSDPISVAVQGRNIPVGTQVNLPLTGSSGVTYTPTTLTGSFDLSSATLPVSGLDRNAETHLFVSAIFDVPQSAVRAR